ncbi:MAG: glycyl-radical enzyme activating protein, partial [Kiritimatiellales bacterium]
MNFNSQITGFIFNVQRFSLHDGPGIRTTVFFKGCPLHCLWCHNPESIDFDMEIGWEPRRCVLCGACIEACPAKCHHVDEKGLHVFDRQTCTQCGRCAKVCMSQALTVVGHRRTANDILNEVLKDRRYYQRSGGGITLSGGEPSAQSVFAMELLKLAKNENLHTCVETCGQTSFRILQDMASFTDLFLYDI